MGSLGILGMTLIMLSVMFLVVGLYELGRESAAIDALSRLPGSEMLVAQAQEAQAFEAFTVAMLFAAGTFAGYLGIRVNHLREEIGGLRWRVEQVGMPSGIDSSLKEGGPNVASPIEAPKMPGSDEMLARRKAAEERRKRAEQTEKPEG